MDIIDLEPNERGIYEVSKTKRSQEKPRSKVRKARNDSYEKVIADSVDGFLSGVDIGLELLESISDRIYRMKNLTEKVR